MLLLVHMSDLEPDIGMRKRIWWIAKNAIEAFLVLSWLLVDDAKPEQDLVGLVKVCRVRFRAG